MATLNKTDRELLLLAGWEEPAPSRSPAIVQVKSGNQAVDLEALAAAAPDAEAVLFACSASGQFIGHPPREVRCVSPDELVAFVREHKRLLPPRVRTWFELATG